MTRLRILQLISSGGYYGAENMAMQLSLALRSLNCEVAIGIFQNAHRPNSEFADAAQGRGLEVELISCKGRIDFRTIDVIHKCIVNREIDVVHSHGYKANIYGYLAARKTNTRLVATCHNWPGKTINLRLYAALDRLLLRRFSKIGVVSSTVQDLLRRSGVRGGHVTLVENGIDTESFSPGRPVLRELPQLQGKKVVGFVGRLAREKGLACLMQAARSILRVSGNVAFVLAGDGPYRDQLRDLVKELDIENHVLLLGARSDLADVYASMDIFVLPSLCEGMPMSVLEAMAAGKPVVASRVGGIPQVVQDEETGLLVSAGDASQLTTALSRLLAAPRLCEELGRRGRDRVNSHFSARAMAETYFTMYRQTDAQWNNLAKEGAPAPVPTIPDQLPTVSDPQISVIIPVLNEQAVIGRCLESLSNNAFPKSAFEVIVVDNGSTDPTIDIAKSFEKTLALKVLRLEKVHISALRNRGAAEARGRFLAFLDADCLAPATWLSNAMRLFQDPQAGVIGAHYGIPDDSTWVGRVWCQDRFAEKVGNVPYVPAGDLLVDRKTFSAIGGFDESIQTNEDFELCERALAAGLPVRSFPALRVTHLGTPRTLLAFYRKQRWHGTHVFTIFLRDPKKKKNRHPVMLALYTSMCLAGILTGSIFGLLGASWRIPAFFAALLLLPLLAIGFVRSARRRKWGDVVPLTCLYLAFGLARARSVLNYKTWRSQSIDRTVVKSVPVQFS
jgi:glycosyltransferase involved in cell wall biosynthesis